MKLAAPRFLKFEWPRADKCCRFLKFQRLGYILPDVFWDNLSLQGDVVDKIGCGIFQMKNDGLSALHLDAFDGIIGFGRADRQRIVAQIFKRKFHIVSGENLTIVPTYIRPKVKSISFFVVRSLPFLGQERDKTVFVFPNQAVEQKSRDNHVRATVGQTGKHRRDIADGESNGVCIVGLFRPAAEDYKKRESC